MVVSRATVEKPATAEELARRLHEAAESGLAVFPVGGGRSLEMGDPPAVDGVELRTKALDRVLEHSQADMVVSVEAGITLEALQEELGKSGQFLPLDPFGSPGHTIGGLLATGWTGPLRLRYGSPRDFLIGIRVALPDGRLASAGGRVVKNVSGYDLMKLHYGALGTTGVIVAASFKVFPKALHDVTVESKHESMAEAWVAAEQVLDMPMAPAAVELFSSGRVLARFLGSPDATRRMVADLGWTAADASVPCGKSTRRPRRRAGPESPRRDTSCAPFSTGSKRTSSGGPRPERGSRTGRSRAAPRTCGRCGRRPSPRAGRSCSWPDRPNSDAKPARGERHLRPCT